MHFKSTILPMLLSAAVPSLCAPVDDKLDVKVEIKVGPGNDGDFALEDNPLHAPRLGSTSAVDHEGHVASKPWHTTEAIVTIDGPFTLQVASYPVGASSEELNPGWFPLSILDSGSPVANFTHVNGVLSQDRKLVMRFWAEDYSLRPKQLFVTGSLKSSPTRWQVFGSGDGRILGFLDGEKKVFASKELPGGLIMFPLMPYSGNANLVIVGGGAGKGVDDGDFGAAEDQSLLATQTKLKK